MLYLAIDSCYKSTPSFNDAFNVTARDDVEKSDATQPSLLAKQFLIAAKAKNWTDICVRQFIANKKGFEEYLITCEDLIAKVLGQLCIYCLVRIK